MTVPVRFVLQMRPVAGGGWTVELRDPDGVTVPGSVRTLAPLPLPHDDDLLLTFPACHAPLAAAAADVTDLHALDSATLGRWYANMASGQASDGMPRRFGRYLF